MSMFCSSLTYTSLYNFDPFPLFLKQILKLTCIFQPKYFVPYFINPFRVTGLFLYPENISKALVFWYFYGV